MPRERHTLSILASRCPQWARAIIPGSHQAIHAIGPLDVAAQFPPLADLVEDIVDWDIPDDRIARGATITVLPTTTPHFIVQYRTPMASSRKFGDATVPHGAYEHVATMVRTGIVTIRPRGPVGAVVARLKPEAATGLLGDHIYEFADTKIELDAVFGANGVAALAQMLAEARSSYDRMVAVLKFLLAHMRPHEPDPVVRRAAASLRRNPFWRLGPLAAELGLSERHLSRRFKAVFGTGPKRFARSARMEQLLSACGGEASWANIACSCGFADQAHMINDFKAILGVTSTAFLRSPSSDESDSTTVQPRSP